MSQNAAGKRRMFRAGVVLVVLGVVGTAYMVSALGTNELDFTRGGCSTSLSSACQSLGNQIAFIRSLLVLFASTLVVGLVLLPLGAQRD